ncbi:MAG: SEC-C metal-binding domain-containing protein, partial [Gemmatimonadaceae bacterium]
RPAALPAALAAATEAATTAFHAKIASLGEFASRLLSLVMLNVLDEKWKDHLYDLDQLRAAIGYRSWGQKDPLVEYKQEAFAMFEDLMRDIQHTFAERFLKVQLVFEQTPPAPLPPPVAEAPRAFDPFGVATPPADAVEPPAPRVVGAGRGVQHLDGPGAARSGEFDGVGRNDPCPCGSGKKFKKCHGA